MFAGFMITTWWVATIVAVVAGLVGFFVVVRGSAFAAHAIPHGSFAGAAGAALIGVNALVGLGVFSVGGALGIGWLARRGRRDVATSLALTFMLGLGALFLSVGSAYAPQVYALLFGEVLGISPQALVPTAALAAACVVAVIVLYRPLLLSSVVPDAGRARGLAPGRLDLLFLLLVALATTMTVPVVGALLIFSLMIGPPAAARNLVGRPLSALGLSVVIALVTVWAAIALSYRTNYPVGFFVGALSAGWYALGRAWTVWQTRRRRPRW